MAAAWQKAAVLATVCTLCAGLWLRVAWGSPPLLAQAPPAVPLHGCPTPGSVPLSAAQQLAKSAADAGAQAKFEEIYQSQHWSKGAGGGSGAGSTVEAARYARLVIELVVHKYHLHSMVDAPCGAMVWMPILLNNLRAAIPCFECEPGMLGTHPLPSRSERNNMAAVVTNATQSRPLSSNHTPHGPPPADFGVDIVRPIIAASAAKFQAVPWMRFAVTDFTREPLPGSADLVFSRDALQHLSLPFVFDALERFAAYLGGDPRRFLLVGSYDPGLNHNITLGAYFHIDLRAKPFELTPLEQFPELAEEGGHPKILLLYSGAQLAAADVGAMRRRARAAGMHV